MNTVKITIGNIISIEGAGPYGIAVIVALACILLGIGFWAGFAVRQ